jgi:hypothetical protein
MTRHENVPAAEILMNSPSAAGERDGSSFLLAARHPWAVNGSLRVALLASNKAEGIQ